ncbi:MAG: hypothetical protein ACUVUS_00790, partial [Thermoproteota archaeon]
DNIVSCTVTTVCRKPYTCVVDGLKTVLDCDISLEEGEGLSARFENNSGMLMLKVNRGLLKNYAESPFEKCEENAYDAMGRSDEELFEF